MVHLYFEGVLVTYLVCTKHLLPICIKIVGWILCWKRLYDSTNFSKVLVDMFIIEHNKIFCNFIHHEICSVRSQTMVFEVLWVLP